MIMILCILFGVIAGIVVFIFFNPGMGGKVTKKEGDRLAKSPNFQGGKFVNSMVTLLHMGLKNSHGVWREYIAVTKRRPEKELPMVSVHVPAFQASTETCAAWLGHSTVILQIDGKTLLFDPVFSQKASPVSWLGPQRFFSKSALEIEDLPAVDGVFISHDHYDHLDYATMKKLRDKTGKFYVPLGVGRHLLRWGIPQEKIEEMDWWDEKKFAGVTIAAAPSRHFSGRGLWNRNSTLWCSWVVIGQKDNIYFSGDGGYGPHFSQIGDKYGPFDLAFMECGQYNQRWATIHMMPEQSVQAVIDICGKKMVPIHWGAFSLAPHDWTEPVERALKAAARLKVDISLLRIGENITKGSTALATDFWWRRV